MRLPQINPSTDRIRMITQFTGYNHNLTGNEGEWYDMTNMTCDNYPVFSQRMKRGIVRTVEKPQGMLGGKNLALVDDNKLYYDDELICTLESTDVQRKMVMVAALLCVFPDGIIYNTYTKAIEYMQNTVTTTEPPTFSLCKQDGTKYTNMYTGDTEPEDKTVYWLDTSQNTVVLKEYTESLDMWVAVSTTYVKVEAEGIGTGFSSYDAATFSGVDQSSAIYNKYDFNKSNLIYECGDDYLVISGLINQSFTNSQNITITRKVPEMDYVCELDNRIWGCSSTNHEIYACKQGDPKNWYCYAGLDSDSYAVTVGTEDDFTGCIAYSGTVYFFKEAGVHKLYGSKPSNYEMTWKPGRGVQKGSEKSLRIIGDYMMYKSRDSVCLYDGSVSTVSGNLGTANYYDAVAGVYRDKYYISMRDEDYNYALYVYDLYKRMWTKEDEAKFTEMEYTSNGLNILGSDGTIWNVNKEKMKKKQFPEDSIYPSDTTFPGDVIGGQEEGAFEWSATSTEMGIDTPYKQYVKRLNMKMKLEEGTRMHVDIMYDDSGIWEKMVTFEAAKRRGYDICVPVRRCDHFKIRITGTGEMTLYNIARAVDDQGGWHD